MTTDMETRVDRLDTMIEEGRVLRHAWTAGAERACLLAALSPEVARTEYASACPAHVMPAWLAHLTPWVDDETSAEAWPQIIRRYAALARRWHRLDGAAWERARIASLLAIVIEARSHCSDGEVRALSAVDGVLGWLRRGAPEAERAQVQSAASFAEEASLAKAASRASRAAVKAASRAAEAEAAKAAAWAASRASQAWQASADRIATAVLDAIEAEIERSER